MFYKSTHTCERRAIWIDKKINIQDNFIHTSSLFIRKTDFLITEMYNWECFLHLEGIQNTSPNFSTSSSGFVALQNSGRHNIFSPVLKPDKLEGGGGRFNEKSWNFSYFWINIVWTLKVFTNIEFLRKLWIECTCILWQSINIVFITKLSRMSR